MSERLMRSAHMHRRDITEEKHIGYSLAKK